MSEAVRFDRGLRRLEPLAADGLVELGRDRLAVTPRGRFVVRNLAISFDAYLGPQTANLYSRTV